MKENLMYLTLENGAVFEGESFGARSEACGELVFTTGMTGYLGALTDCGFYGQIVIQTFPLIGNYGFIPCDLEGSRIHLSAYVVNQWCKEPSNFRSQGNIDDFLKRNGIPGLCGVDTRALTKIVREHGAMKAKITATLPAAADGLNFDDAPSMKDAVKNVTCAQTSLQGDGAVRVVVWDFGAKDSLAKELLRRGARVITVPAHSTAKEILALSPDGLLLSNGPGNPSDNKEIIAEIEKFTQIARYTNKKIPIMGICLGHQMLALSQGMASRRMHCGHRGANQPVKDTMTGKIYITSQNHGYDILSESVTPNAMLRYVNVNDASCEGIDYLDMTAFSVQFHPEAGYCDTNFLFDRFMSDIADRSVS